MKTIQKLGKYFMSHHVVNLVDNSETFRKSRHDFDLVLNLWRCNCNNLKNAKSGL